MRGLCGGTGKRAGRGFKLGPDHESDVFFIGTCNQIEKLPPEFARAESFDGVFFVDLPGREHKNQIWGIYTGHYGLDPRRARLDDTQ